MLPFWGSASLSFCFAAWLFWATRELIYLFNSEDKKNSLFNHYTISLQWDRGSLEWQSSKPSRVGFFVGMRVATFVKLFILCIQSLNAGQSPPSQDGYSTKKTTTMQMYILCWFMSPKDVYSFQSTSSRTSCSNLNIQIEIYNKDWDSLIKQCNSFLWTHCLPRLLLSLFSSLCVLCVHENGGDLFLHPAVEKYIS